MTHEEKLALAREFNKKTVLRNKVSEVSIEKLIASGDLKPGDLDNLLEMYGEYIETGKVYEIGDRFRYKKKLYRVEQKHTTQTGYTPDNYPLLYTDIAPDGVLKEWKQPKKAEEAYPEGAKVLFNGSAWVSVYKGANSWSPDGYGWKAI